MKLPKYHLRKVYEGGSREEPAVYELHELPRLGGCRMGRRGFLITSAVGAGLLASLTMGCDSGPEMGRDSEPEKETMSKPKQPQVSANNVSGVAAHWPDTIHCLTFSPDGKILVSCSADKKVKYWSVPDGKLLGIVPTDSFAMTLARFSPDGQTLMLAGNDHTLSYWRAPFSAPFRTVKKIGSTSCTAPAISPDCKFMAVGWNNHREMTGKGFSPGKTFLRLSSLPEGKEILHLAREKEMEGLAFSPDGAMLAIKERGKPAHFEIVSLPSGETITRWPGEGFLMGFSPDGRLLASRRWEVLDFWSMPSGEPFPAPDIALERYGDSLAVFSPDGSRLALASNSHAIELLPKPYAEPAVKLEGHTAMIMNLAFSPDGRYLASGSDDGVIFLWKLEAEGTGATFHAALHDPQAVWSDTEFTFASVQGGGTFTGTCGSPLPAGAVCICNCVSGNSPSKPSRPSGGGGGGGCSCVPVCTCVPVK